MESLGMFTMEHFIWLCMVGIMVGVILMIGMMTRAKLNSFLTFAIIFLVLFDLVKMSYNVSYSDDPTAPWQKGFYTEQFILPFHLCAIQVYLMIFARCSKKDSFVRKLLLPAVAVCSVIGGILACVIPVEGVAFGATDPLKMIMPYRYFMAHGLLIATGFRIAFDEETEWTFKSYLRTVSFLFMMFVGSIYVNSMFHTNFMYTAYPPAENIPILSVVEGDLSSWYRYLGILIGAVLVLVTIFYIPGLIATAVRNSKQKKAEKAEKAEQAKIEVVPVPMVEDKKDQIVEAHVESEPVYEDEYDEEEDLAPITVSSILESSEEETKEAPVEETPVEETAEAPVEEAVAEETPVEETVEEVPAEDVPAEETEEVAEVEEAEEVVEEPETTEEDIEAQYEAKIAAIEAEYEAKIAAIEAQIAAIDAQDEEDEEEEEGEEKPSELSTEETVTEEEINQIEAETDADTEQEVKNLTEVIHEENEFYGIEEEPAEEVAEVEESEESEEAEETEAVEETEEVEEVAEESEEETEAESEEEVEESEEEIESETEEENEVEDEEKHPEN